MQMGTLGGPILVAIAIVVVKRDWLLGAVVVATGAFTWPAAKGVKRLVDRDRPLFYLSDIVVRDGDGSGLGFISGHSAVAASAILLALVVSRNGGDPCGWRDRRSRRCGACGRRRPSPGGRRRRLELRRPDRSRRSRRHRGAQDSRLAHDRRRAAIQFER